MDAPYAYDYINVQRCKSTLSKNVRTQFGVFVNNSSDSTLTLNPILLDILYGQIFSITQCKKQ